MPNLNDIHAPSEAVLLVGFSDLSGYSRYSRGRPGAELFATMSAYAEFSGKIVEDAGGRVVKYIGDAMLFVFTEDRADAAVNAMLALKNSGDAWLRQRGIQMRHVIKAHLGPVACGPFGTGTDKRFDVYGETVNIAALTPSQGLAVTAQVFRRLAPETRKLLKKHTPPVTYLPLEENHGNQ